jgi:hypothetical protein
MINDKIRTQSLQEYRELLEKRKNGRYPNEDEYEAFTKTMRECNFLHSELMGIAYQISVNAAISKGHTKSDNAPKAEHWRLTTLLVGSAAFNEWRSLRIAALLNSHSYEHYCQLIEEVDADFVAKYEARSQKTPVDLKAGTGILNNAKFTPNARQEKTPVDLNENKGRAYHCHTIAFGPNGGIDWKDLEPYKPSPFNQTPFNQGWSTDSSLWPNGIYGGSSKPTSSCKEGSECVGSCPCKEGSAKDNGGSCSVDLGAVQNGVSGTVHHNLKSSVNDGVLNQVDCQIPEPPKLRDWVLQKDMDFFGRTIPKGTIYKQVNSDYYHPIVNGNRCPSLQVDFYIVKNNPDYFQPYETDLQLEAKDHITLCEAAQDLLFNDKEETLAIMIQIGNNLSFGLCCNHAFAEFLSNEIKEARLCYEGKPNKFE